MNHPGKPELKADALQAVELNAAASESDALTADRVSEAGAPAAKGPWAAVGKPRAHESARLHVLGQATYTDDIPELQGTLHAALGLSSKAHANILGMDLTAVRASPGVVAV